MSGKALLKTKEDKDATKGKTSQIYLHDYHFFPDINMLVHNSGEIVGSCGYADGYNEWADAKHSTENH